jgi:hypothetical protein
MSSEDKGVRGSKRVAQGRCVPAGVVPPQAQTVAFWCLAFYVIIIVVLYFQ